MSEVNVQIQNPNTSVNITEPEIIIQITENSIEVVLEEGQPISIQVQNPVIEVNMGCCTPGNISAGHIIQDEGVSLAARAKLNFIGAGVTATDNPGDGSTDVTIPGGGGGGASITDITYADMQTALTGGTLTEGAFYRITDAAGTDLGFVCQAIKTNEITVNGTGGYLNADFQAEGDYTGVEAVTGVAPGTQLGIWRTGFEVIAIPYTSLQFPADYVSYSTSSGPLDPAETFTTDLGTTGEVITDDGAGTVTVQNLSQALTAGEVITGDTSTNTVTVDSYTVTVKVFAVGDTITGGTTGATAVIVTDDGASSMTAYMTSAGVAFDGSEVLDNGSGVTADQDGAAGSPAISLGDIVIWNSLHWQLVDITLLNGTNPQANTAAYRALLKRDEQTNEVNTGQGYIEVWDFSFLADGQIIGREDALQNKIYGQYVSEFKWGSTDAGNICNRGSIISKNAYGNISGNTVFEEASIDPGNNNVAVRKNVLYSLSRIGGITTHGQSSVDIGNNIFLPSSYIDNISTFADLQLAYSTINPAVTITEGTVRDNTTIVQCEIKQSWFEVNFAKHGGLEVSYSFFGNALNSLTISDQIISKTSEPGFSDIPGTIDIDGLTTLDITAALAQYRGIINVTSPNATENIDTISNPPTLFQFTIRPAAGLALTITGTAYSGIAAGQIALKAASYVLDGDKGEYIVLEIDPLGTGCLIEKYVVNGLI